ncbi:hypothetical protein FDN13_13270 [Caloramator sp. E03]|uniref:DUF6762 family protein n=1 Tax=Caloramator sp. E03 TaxID=2576307 RepID=UPI001110B186|nr:DUF6762 family protein [Caloramator sp. E03]QCX34593.1 hypothetical protein FDN13_13270 [Caloramator sp. E03]
MEADSVVLMEKENGILAKELGSYRIETGIEYIYKAYVEEENVKLFLTTDVDVSDDEYNEIYDEYNFEPLLSLGCEVEEVEGEYNPVWLVRIPFEKVHDDMEKKLNDIVSYHEKEIKSIFKKLRSNPL